MISKQKSNIWIESKEFNNRTEFRVGVREKYPKGFRQGMYEDSLGYWQRNGSVGGKVDFVFYAYKKNNWLKRFLGNDYRNQRRVAIQKCDELILKYKESEEIPKIQVYKR